MSETATGPAEPLPGLEDAYRADRGYLFGLLYRLTGSAQDAEDLLQATFERALSRPPPDRARPWRPWLARVALNLGRDHLRRRRRRAYDGPWLPEPIEEAERFALPAHEPADTEGRYELLESVSYAFLLALEALTPTQRAVLLLRDVFDYTGSETAEALGLREPNVRQHLRRARLAMAPYDATRPQREPDAAGRMVGMLGRFLEALATGDITQVESLLSEDVVLTTDAGGEFHAARVEVTGASRVARFHLNVLRLSGPPTFELRTLNGMPALVGTATEPREGIAPRFATIGWLDASGRIARICTVLAPRKLEAILGDPG